MALWYGIIPLVNAMVNVDKAGRLVLPKAVRDEMRISPGDALELHTSENNIVLRPARSQHRLYKKNGIWVLHTGSPVTTETVRDTIREIREERENQILGKDR